MIRITRLGMVGIVCSLGVLVHAALGLHIPALREFSMLAWLLLVPGALALLVIRPTRFTPAEMLVSTLALSVVIIILGGLGANVLLHVLGIIRPLSLLPLLLWFDGIIVLLAAAAFERWPAGSVMSVIAFPSLSPLDRFVHSAVWVLPPLAVIGALLLNAGRSGTVSLVALGLCAAVILTVFLLRGRLRASVYAPTVLAVAATLVLIGWTRSAYVSGVDIDVEYHVFQLVRAGSYWHPGLFHDAYNACMSVTIFPTVLAVLTGIRDQLIFKSVIPCIFAFAPLAVFLTVRRYAEPAFAFLGACFVMSLSAFNVWWSIPIKQEVALFLFSVLVFMLSAPLQRWQRTTLILVLGVGMALSHYTTTYITLALLLAAAAGGIIYRLLLKQPRARAALLWLRVAPATANQGNQGSGSSVALIPLWAVLALCVVTAAWYGPATGTSDTTVRTVQTIVGNLGDIFDENVRQAGVVGSVLNPFWEEPEPRTLLATYAQTVQNQSRSLRYQPDYYSNSVVSTYTPRYYPDDVTPRRFGSLVSSGAYAGNEVSSTFVKLLLLLGVALLLFVHLRHQDMPAEIVILATAALFVLAAIIVLPFASLFYSVSRTYQQIAVVLALPFALACEGVYRASRKTWVAIPLVLIIIGPLLFSSGFVGQIVGGSEPVATLNNAGRTYEEVYTHRTDIAAARWVLSQQGRVEVNAASRAREKLWLLPHDSSDYIIAGIFPHTMRKDAYVFADRTNTIEGKAFISTAGTTVSYEFPQTFLEEHKNRLYHNGAAQVFQ